MFKKKGEIKVFKPENNKKGFTKKTAKNNKPSRYTIDDLVSDADKGIDPYKEKEIEDEKKEVIK